MTLVMTLLARDEIDVVDSWLSFHLNAGVDLVIATDNRSQDGTTEVLEEYARSGQVHLIREPGEDLRQDEWVTRMARLAATEYGADWVINSDADEFWWPRGASLSEVLGGRAASATGRSARSSGSSARDRATEHFAERMTVRFSALAPINDPASLYKPIRKIIHRGHPEIRLTRGNHALVRQPVRAAPRLVPGRVPPLPAAHARPVRAQGGAPGSGVREAHRPRPPTAYHADMYAALAQRDGSPSTTRRSSSPTKSSSEGVAQGRLVVDTRLRDALRADRDAAATPLRFPLPTLVEDAEYAVEAAVLGEADVVRLQRRLDELERRLQTVEQRLPRRVYRKLTRTAKRALGRKVRPMSATTFVILTTQRSGSRWLVDLLDDHPSVAAYESSSGRGDDRRPSRGIGWSRGSRSWSGRARGRRPVGSSSTGTSTFAAWRARISAPTPSGSSSCTTRRATIRGS